MSQIVSGGGFNLLTDDPILIAVVKRCAELQAQLKLFQNHQDMARFRSLRRDVDQIAKCTKRIERKLP